MLLSLFYFIGNINKLSPISQLALFGPLICSFSITYSFSRKKKMLMMEHLVVRKHRAPQESRDKSEWIRRYFKSNISCKTLCPPCFCCLHRTRGGSARQVDSCVIMWCECGHCLLYYQCELKVQREWRAGAPQALLWGIWQASWVTALPNALTH